MVSSAAEGDAMTQSKHTHEWAICNEGYDTDFEPTFLDGHVEQCVSCAEYRTVDPDNVQRSILIGDPDEAEGMLVITLTHSALIIDAYDPNGQDVLGSKFFSFEDLFEAAHRLAAVRAPGHGYQDAVPR